SAGEEELMALAKELGAPYELVRYVHQHGKLPVPNFAAGGVATPADAALMMQLGADGVFVGSGIFKSANPAARARAIVEAVAHYDDPAWLAKVSGGLGEAMPGIAAHPLGGGQRKQAGGGRREVDARCTEAARRSWAMQGGIAAVRPGVRRSGGRTGGRPHGAASTGPPVAPARRRPVGAMAGRGWACWPFRATWRSTAPR